MIAGIDGNWSQAMLLSEFVARHFRPRLERKIKRGQSRPRNLEAYEETFELWLALVGDSPLTDLEWGSKGVQLGEDFSDRLAERPGRKNDKISGRTINKHLTAMASILAEAGPRTKKHPSAAGLIKEPPVWERMRESLEDPVPYSLAELETVLSGVERLYMPAAWWRRLGIVTYYTGLRRQALVRFAGESQPTICSKWLRRDEWGLWLWIPAEASKTHSPYWVSIPPWMAEPFEAMPPNGPWFSWSASQNWFSRRATKQGLALHRVRKTTGTQLARIDSMASSMQLGHAGGVTQRHYIGPQFHAEKVGQMPRLAVEW